MSLSPGFAGLRPARCVPRLVSPSPVHRHTSVRVQQRNACRSIDGLHPLDRETMILSPGFAGLRPARCVPRLVSSSPVHRHTSARVQQRNTCRSIDRLHPLDRETMSLSPGFAGLRPAWCVPRLVSSSPVHRHTSVRVQQRYACASIDGFHPLDRETMILSPRCAGLRPAWCIPRLVSSFVAQRQSESSIITS